MNAQVGQQSQKRAAAGTVDFGSIMNGVWFLATIGIGLWIAVYFAVPGLQMFQDKVLRVSFYTPLAGLIAAILWFAFGHDKVTGWLAQARNSMFHTGLLAVGLLGLSVLRFLPVVLQVGRYLWQNTDRSAVGLCVGSVILGAIALGIFLARKK